MQKRTVKRRVVLFNDETALVKLRAGNIYLGRLRAPFIPNAKGALIMGQFPGGTRTLLEIVNDPVIREIGGDKFQLLDFKLSSSQT